MRPRNDPAEEFESCKRAQAIDEDLGDAERKHFLYRSASSDIISATGSPGEDSSAGHRPRRTPEVDRCCRDQADAPSGHAALPGCRLLWRLDAPEETPERQVVRDLDDGADDKGHAR